MGFSLVSAEGAPGTARRALDVGVATWIGLLVGTAVKLALAFVMVGVFVIALLWH